MIEAVLALLAGLLLGSFLNVCIYRLPRDLSVVRPRSFCPACEKTIAWYDNIPVLSFLLLKGRCRHCGERITLRYPIVELATAAAFFSVVLTLGPTRAAAKLCLFAALVIALIASDLEERILPDEFTLGGIALGLIVAAFVPLLVGLAPLIMPARLPVVAYSIGEAAIGALFSGGALWLVGEVYRRARDRDGLGLGDVKMVAMIGAFLGLPGALMTVLAGSLLGSVTGVLYIWLARKDASTYELPLGSFLGVAGLGLAFYAQLVHL